MQTPRFPSVTAFAAALLATTLAAQQPAPRSFASTFFFGDSLTDSGNTFALTGSPPSPPYFAGRVSNGPTYAEYLRPGLAAHATAAPSVRTNLNFAFAGATAMPGSAVPTLPQQIALYQSRGISAGANDLFVLLAGANDLLNTVAVPAGQSNAAMVSTGTGASQAVAGAVQTLAGLGARNIVVINLPDISKTARFVTGSGVPAASLIQQGSLAFNNDLRGRVGGLTLPAGTNVTVFDLGAVFNGILANAPRFGFTVTTQEYLGILLAGGNPGDVNNYVFFDGIHPTTKTHAILAGALTEVLNPEFVLGTSAAQGSTLLAAADLSLDAVEERLDALRTAGRGASGAFLSYSLKSGALDPEGYRRGFDYDVRAFTAGFDHRFSDAFSVGLALAQETAESTLAAGAGSFKLEGVTGSVYAQWRGARFFADASVGYGAQDVISIRRPTALGGLQAGGETNGDRQTASIRVGGTFGADELRLAPFVGLRYIKGDLEAYTEAGVPGLNFVHDNQTAKAIGGVVGLAARWQATAGLAVDLSAAYQSDLRDDNRTLSGRLADTVAATARAAIRDGNDDSFKLGARVGGVLGGRWGWAVGYQADVRSDGDTASRYSLGVSTAF